MRKAALALITWLGFCAGAVSLCGGDAQPEIPVDDGWRYTSNGWENISTWGIERQRITGVPLDSALLNRSLEKNSSLWVVSVAVHPLSLTLLLLLATVPLWVFPGGSASEATLSSE